jgi:NTE family protein
MTVWAFAAMTLLSCAFVQAAAEKCPAPRAEPGTARTASFPTPGLRVGLALGAGSTHGVAHIGVIEELEARGLDVQVVAGTSVGAVIGALWASGMTGRQIEELGRSVNWTQVGTFAWSWEGLFNSRDLAKQLRIVFAGRPIENWPRRFGAVATNLANGHRRIFTSGDGALAVQASSALPVFFMPVTIDREKFADGALVEPVPVDAARALGADFVIAVDVAYRSYEAKASGLIDYGFQSIHIVTNALGARQIRDADVGIRLDLHHLLMDCGDDALVQAGREAVRGAWPEIERKLRLLAAAR